VPTVVGTAAKPQILDYVLAADRPRFDVVQLQESQHSTPTPVLRDERASSDPRSAIDEPRAREPANPLQQIAKFRIDGEVLRREGKY
jgi:hypothetical protein